MAETLCMLSCFSHVRLCNPMDHTPPGSSVHEILHCKNTGVGCHFLLQGILSTQGIESVLALLALEGRIFTTSTT